jgi:hypothetical protein
MVKRMDKSWKRVPAGTFAGDITFASTEEVDAHGEIAAEFIRTIFAFEPGDYAISDESDILDFMSFDESDTSDVWSRIERAYGLTQVDVGSGRLLQIVKAISGKRGTQ